MVRFDKEYSDYLHGKCKNYNQSLISALEEMEKEGEKKKMRDKEFSEWLRDEHEALMKEKNMKPVSAAVLISEKNAEIEELKLELRLHKRLISRIFWEYRELKRRCGNGENREGENAGL